jgi:hypothetical protein
MGLVSTLYRIAGVANDVRVLSSGNPKRIARRYANKALGGTWSAGCIYGEASPPTCTTIVQNSGVNSGVSLSRSFVHFHT